MAEIEPTIDKLNESTVMLNMRKLAEAVDKNILIEDADKKTIQEQISELKSLLGKE